MTPQNGTVRAQSYSGASDTGMEALTASSSNTHVSDMDSISSASNYSVTWKETYTTARRSGFILRANGSNTQNP